MKKIILLAIGLVSFFTFSNSQGVYPEEIFLIRDFTNHKAAMGETLSRIHMPYANIMGSPYLYDDFTEGEAISKDSIRYVNVQFRFNIFADQMEFLMEDEVLILANPHDFSFFFLGESVLFHQALASKGGVAEKGYFLLLTYGPSASLSKKINIVYEAPKNPQPYTAAKPARFIRKSDTYFLKFQGNAPTRLRLDNRRVINAFPDKTDEIKSFVSENELDLKTEEDLVKLVRYYNSL